ncbi:hypothetical protein [Thiocapsa sp. N5-Cardenillas]|uniref:hypothetical protein n=1 Tax=Thiocapsa sp. N5-Cardenillas TaxID=3137397 RepID=UPI0035AFD298
MNLEQEQELQDYLKIAKGIAWDTCHKIYILLDDAQMEEMDGYGYDPLISADTTTPEGMFDTVWRWYEDSCSLKFISAVKTTPGGDSEFYDIVPQFD